METTINQRIKIIIEWDKSNPEQFSKIVGVSGPAIRKIINGDNEPSSALVRSILKAYPQLSTDWLILGIGDMLRIETKVETKATEEAVSEMRHQLKVKDSQIERLISMLELSFKNAGQLSKFNGRRLAVSPILLAKGAYSATSKVV